MAPSQNDVAANLNPYPGGLQLEQGFRGEPQLTKVLCLGETKESNLDFFKAVFSPNFRTGTSIWVQ